MFATAPLANVSRALAMSTNGVSTGTPTALTSLTVPPTSVYAAYNVIAAPKQVIVVPETGHFRVPAQTERMDAWLREQLGVR